MHHLTKKTLLKEYGERLDAGLKIDELMQLLAEDQRIKSAAEANEIREALLAPDNGSGQPSLGKGNVNNVECGSLNRKYEEWKVKPVYEDIFDNADKMIGRKITGYEKDAQKPIKTTLITPDKAELLNSQSENTLLRLYEVA